MASLALLRKQAKDAGISAAVIRGASSADELQSILDDHNGGEDEAPKTPRKKAVAKKKSAGTSTAKKSAAKKTSAVKKSATSKSKPAATKSGNSGKAKRTTTGTNGYVPKGGRNLLDGVDFTMDDGWNAREGSAPSRIIKALRKGRGNRDKAFDTLVGDVWDFVGKKKRDGSKRTKAEAEAMLRYRIARTAWDFALRTGQHEKAENRVEYGTGGTGQGTFQRAKGSTRGTGATKKTTAKKSGAKKSSAKKASAKKRTSRR